MSNISRHQAGATVAGEKTGGQFKAGERTAADGGALGGPEMPAADTSSLPSSSITTSWSCNECGENTSVPLTELPEIGTPICGDCGEDMELGPNVDVSTTAARAALAHQFRTQYGVNEEQMSSLKTMFERDLTRTLTDRDREELMDLADAMEEANFHTESMEVEALVARSEYDENPRMKLSGTRAWSLAASRHTPQVLKDLVKIEDPSSYESAMGWIRHSTRTPFEL